MSTQPCCDAAAFAKVLTVSAAAMAAAATPARLVTFPGRIGASAVIAASLGMV
ncbi:MAG TPA: hypothetical protein VEV63_10775 [Streptosporangiaceae bacterium]|nr:hypothetical protein [Streptosporangiaceae bacterium]